MRLDRAKIIISFETEIFSMFTYFIDKSPHLFLDFLQIYVTVSYLNQLIAPIVALSCGLQFERNAINS